MVSLPLHGRGRLHTGAPTARAAGNTSVTSDVRGHPAAQPGKGDAIRLSPFPSRIIPTSPDHLLLRSRTPAYQNNRLVLRDRHVLERRGYGTTSPARQQPASGRPNPQADGPPRPSYGMINRTLSWQIGTDGTRNLDNDAPHATTMAGDRVFPLGNQGSSPWERVHGGTPGLYRPYGARGRVLGPEPRVVAQPGGPYRAGVVLNPGSPQDGPQKVHGGLPHGLHSQTMPPLATTMDRRANTVQMRPGRQGRPSNSRIAGQSYSQTVVHQDGTGGGRLPTLQTLTRQPGQTERWLRT